MKTNDPELSAILSKLSPVILPPADYPPSIIVRDTPREELVERIRANAEEVGIDLTEEHWEIIHFLLDFYVNCCEVRDPGYLDYHAYWKQVDCCEDSLNAQDCPYGTLNVKKATSAYRVYRVLLKAFKHKGGKKHLYRLFPHGPLFTIHLLAQLPRLRHDIDPHSGTAY